MKVIHFTDNENFSLADLLDPQLIEGISKEFGGLFVYKYSSDFPDEIWEGREKFVFEIDEKYLELVQENPLDDDSRLDEYLIRRENFKFIK